MAATVLSSEPSSGWSPSFSVRATQTTLAPSPANSSAMAPMPRLAPVTIATRPVILAMASLPLTVEIWPLPGPAGQRAQFRQ